MSAEPAAPLIGGVAALSTLGLGLAAHAGVLGQLSGSGATIAAGVAGIVGLAALRVRRRSGLAALLVSGQWASHLMLAEFGGHSGMTHAAGSGLDSRMTAAHLAAAAACGVALSALARLAAFITRTVGALTLRPLRRDAVPRPASAYIQVPYLHFRGTTRTQRGPPAMAGCA